MQIVSHRRSADNGEQYIVHGTGLCSEARTKNKRSKSVGGRVLGERIPSL